MSNYPISVDVINPEGYYVTMGMAALTQSCQRRFERAVDRLWFRYNPPRTEWWVKTAQWFIRRGKQIAGNYRYWRYVRRL